MKIKSYNEYIFESKDNGEVSPFLIPNSRENIQHNLNILNLNDKDVKINDDLTVTALSGIKFQQVIEYYNDSNGDYNTYRMEEIPIKFSKANNKFYIDNLYLTSLNNSPEYVEFTFNCAKNYLTSLVGGPKIVGVDYVCYDMELNNLEGCAEYIGGDLVAFGCGFETLIGFPKKILGNVDLQNCNNLSSFDGVPIEYNKFKNFFHLKFAQFIKLYFT